jgi:small redox-active disulfide protein 2
MARSTRRCHGGNAIMKTIEVLGPGCNNCMRLEKNTREAVAMAGIEAEIIKVTDYAQIAQHGVMSTPGLVIDGVVRSYGRVPSVDEVAGWLRS